MSDQDRQTYLEGFSFKALPVEVQSLLLRSDESTKYLSRAPVEKRIHKTSRYQLLKDECMLPISRAEVQKYVQDYQPIAYAELYFTKKHGWWNYMVKIIITPDHK